MILTSNRPSVDGPAERRPMHRLVTQTDHAALAAEILGLWRTDGLPDNPRRELILFAAREHDNGWRESDAAPRVDPEGAPHGFRTLPDAERFDLWHRGIERYAAERPYAAALIAHHAVTVYRGRASTDAWREQIESWGARRDELLTSAGDAFETADEDLEAATFEADYRFVNLTDTISLAACEGWSEGFDDFGLRIEPRPDDGRSSESATTVALDPFPLAGATTFRVDCRRLEARSYEGDTDFALALAAARREPLFVRLVDAAA